MLFLAQIISCVYKRNDYCLAFAKIDLIKCRERNDAIARLLLGRVIFSTRMKYLFGHEFITKQDTTGQVGFSSRVARLFLRCRRSISRGAFIFLYFSSRVSREEADDRIRRVSMHKTVRVIR